MNEKKFILSFLKQRNEEIISVDPELNINPFWIPSEAKQSKL